MKIKVAAVITTFNRKAQLRSCLDHLLASDCDLSVIVVDDGSTDGTSEMLGKHYRCVKTVNGDGNLWWTGATNRGVTQCLQSGHSYVLLLNPDVLVEPNTISKLVDTSTKHAGAIVGAVVVRFDRPDLIWWAGGEWKQFRKWLPIWHTKHNFRQNTPTSALPVFPLQTSEVHGRAVLIPVQVFNSVGIFDEHNFPHYGADLDFSYRVKKARIAMLIQPGAKVRLHVESSGMINSSPTFRSLLGYLRYLTVRKNGDALRVWWRLLRRYAPPHALITTYLAVILVNTMRYWQMAFARKKSFRTRK